MNIGEVARQVGVTPQAIRFYEQHGLLPEPPRQANGYRSYDDEYVERLKVLVGLRRLDMPLAQASDLANLCADGKCARVAADLLPIIERQRETLTRQIAELSALDGRLADVQKRLRNGEPPRPLITVGKE